MTTKTKPTIVLVHGAWHDPRCWDPVAAVLKQAGYDTVAPALVSCEWGAPASSHLQDVAVVRAEIEKLVSAGKEVVLVLHSYGGVGGGGAVAGLEKKAGSNSGGVIGAVFLAAFLVPKGSSLISMFPEQPSYLRPHPEDPRFVISDDTHELFYGDSTREEAEPWLSILRPQSLAAFASTVETVAWDYVPCTYISCRKDKAVYPWLQDQMIEGAKKDAKYPFTVVNLDNDHSAWLSNPSAVGKVIIDVAENSS